MNASSKAIITALYGVWLAVAGLLRGTNAAIGFGLTTGVMAIVGAILISKGKSLASRVLIGITLLFVVGFFISKSAREGVDFRVGMILLSSLIEAVVIFMPSKAIAESPSASTE
jgi:hypothetical protein